MPCCCLVDDLARANDRRVAVSHAAADAVTGEPEHRAASTL